MPYPNEHACRVRQPEQYGDNIRRVNDALGPGIDVIYGIKNDESEIQALRFSAKKFTEVQARKWLREHDFKCLEFEVATGEDNAGAEDEKKAETAAEHEKLKLETEDMPDQEIFSVGTHTDSAGKTRVYTAEDLKLMAIAYSDLEPRVLAPVKLGHNKKQKAVFDDGLPAAGWLHNIRAVGDKLVADLKRVPKKIAALIRAGAYRHKSLELYPNFNDEATGKTYRWMPTGLAILGAQIPALSDLNSLMGLYSSQNYFSHNAESTIINYQEGGGEMDEKDKKIAELEAEIKALKEKLTGMESGSEEAKAKAAESDKHSKELSDNLEKKKAMIADLEKQIADYAKARAEATEKEINSFLTLHAKRFPPIMREHFKSMLLEAESKSDYSIKIADAEIRGAAGLRKHIESLPESDLFKEFGKGDGKPASDEEREEESVKAYCKENSLDYSRPDHYRAAVKAVRKGGDK